MILVTDTKQPLGRAVAARLQQDLTAYRTLTADLDNRNALLAELEGVEKVFLITEPFHEQQMVRENVLLDVANKQKVKHIIRVSLPAWGATAEARAQSEWLTERWAVDHFHTMSGRMAPAHTLLRPNTIAQEAVVDGSLRIASGSSKVAAVHMDDVVDVIVACLTDDKHKRKEYHLTGSEALTMKEIASRLGARYQPTSPFARMIQGLLGQQTAPEQSFSAVQADFLSRGEESAVNNTIEEILGRPATKL